MEEGRGREKLFQWRWTGGGTKGDKKAASRLRQRGGRFRRRRICGSSGLLVGQGRGDHGGRRSGGGGGGGGPRPPLFVPSANTKDEWGEFRGCWVPSPSRTSPEDIARYVVFGRLIGSAMRTGILLALDLPLPFWKLLCGEGLVMGGGAGRSGGGGASGTGVDLVTVNKTVGLMLQVTGLCIS